MSLFPLLQPAAEAAPAAALPLCRDIDWDYAANRPLWRAGAPVLAEGAAAVRAWACRALQTPRGRYEAFGPDYGSECDALIGEAYTEELKRAEAIRFVRECLEVNPYVEAVRELAVAFAPEGLLTISCTLATIYGEVEINV